jgi:rhodanese-related sulfurtransferase
MLYDSTREKLLTLPDSTLVYPGHGAGSMCGKNLSTDTFSTMGDQRRFNYALQPMSREEFIAMITANQPKVPAYFGYDAQFNRQERETLESALQRLGPLSMSDLDQALTRGAVALDVRPAEEFAAGHLEGALNIGLEGRFASWAGTVIDREAEVVLLAPAGLERESALRLGRIGYDRVIGYLEGGPDAVPEARLRVTTRVDPADFSAALQDPGGPLVLDVRQPGERGTEALEGTLNIPLGDLSERLEELPRDRPLAMHCLSGYRSMVAASLLERAGFGDLADLRGGLEAWKAAELPTITGEGVACS